VARLTGKGTNLLYGIRPDIARRLLKVNAPIRDLRFNLLASALYQDTFGKYLTTLLRYGDRNSMAHSREVRLPFCDHRIAELVFSLPPWYLMGEVQTKRILREAMCGILPEKIRTRWSKQGFRPPQDLWFQGSLLEKVREIIEDPSFKRSPIWVASWWRKVLKRIQNGEGYLGWTLWQPLMMEAWKRCFVDRLRKGPRVAVNGEGPGYCDAKWHSIRN
jgi:asparagine synthase (glutamine-hydrolysing)